jgi:prepilin-type N-terminal cleavage/methylation domain-containing protein
MWDLFMEEAMLKDYKEDRRESGFTLIELLIAVVVVGILAAVVIVGIGGLNGSAKKSACTASLDAAKAAVAVHYSNTDGTYPTTFDAMVTAKELDLGTGTTSAGAVLTHGSDWSITLTPGNPPTFSACP